MTKRLPISDPDHFISVQFEETNWESQGLYTQGCFVPYEIRREMGYLEDVLSRDLFTSFFRSITKFGALNFERILEIVTWNHQFCPNTLQYYSPRTNVVLIFAGF